MANNTIKEYEFLRNEINQHIGLHNTLLTFAITSTVAVLALALDQNRTILYLIPFCILIPMSMRIAYYRSAMVKLSAYMIVFLEIDLDGVSWETRNAALVNDLNKKKKDINSYTVLRYFECLILAVICYILYVIDYIKDKEISVVVIVNILWPLLFVIWEILITKRINSVDDEKQEWIKRWNKLKMKCENYSSNQE